MAHVLLVSSIETPTEVSVPSVAQTHVVLVSSTEVATEVSVGLLRETPPLAQDTDFTVYVPGANNNVFVGVENDSNATSFTVYVQEENRQIRIAA